MNKRPFIILKQAQTLDGFLDDGSSLKISNETDRRCVHTIRSMVDAILVGAQTVRSDNPSLTVDPKLCYSVDPQQPIRIIIEGQKILDQKFKVFTDSLANTIVFRSEKNIITTPNDYKQIPYSGSRLEMNQLLDDLYNRGIRSVLVEGGANTIEQFLSEACIDAHRILHAPIVLTDIKGTKVNTDSSLYSKIVPKIEKLDSQYASWFIMNEEGINFYQRYLLIKKSNLVTS